MNVILTSEDPPSSEVQKLAEEKGINIIHVPLIKTIPLEKVNIPNKEYDFLIITSAKTVKHFLAKDTSISRNTPVLTTGEKTKKALESVGFKKVIIAGNRGVESIKEYILKHHLQEKKFLFLRAEKGKNIDLPNIDVVPVYKTVFNRPKEFSFSEINAIIFTSPSTFLSFKELFKENFREVLKSITIIAIGNTTKKEIKKEGLKVDLVPPKPSIREIIKLL